MIIVWIAALIIIATLAITIFYILDWLSYRSDNKHKTYYIPLSYKDFLTLYELNKNKWSINFSFAADSYQMFFKTDNNGYDGYAKPKTYIDFVKLCIWYEHQQKIKSDKVDREMLEENRKKLIKMINDEIGR